MTSLDEEEDPYNPITNLRMAENYEKARRKIIRDE